MNKIVINDVSISSNRIDYKYDVSGEWVKCFNLSESFFVEYNIDISNIPVSIAVIPLLANILPMAWVNDAVVVVPACDKAFFDSITKFKKGYENMFPNVVFSGKIIANSIEENHPGSENGVAVFFSGGVDAFNTLVQHVDERPSLITLWGADVKLDDKKGWSNVLSHLQSTVNEFDLDYVFVKSAFRIFLNEQELTKRISHSGDGWWHGFQHGIGIISHAAPVAYVKHKKSVYFASSFTAADKGKYKCASDPTIDNYIKFADSNVIHDGYEFSRQMKIHNLAEYSKGHERKLSLRVCWESKGGSNCCKCEKCWRTILGLYAEKVNPIEFGFTYDNIDCLAKQIYKNRHLLKHNRHSRYAPIQKALHENYSDETIHPALRWFYNTKIEKLGNTSLTSKIIRKIRVMIKNKFSHV